jgi:dihydroorotate dehydrogenase (NAD+) catalytic subunit
MLNLNGVRLRNRIVFSSSSFEYGRKYWEDWLIRPQRAGAVTTRTLTLRQREGHLQTILRPWDVVRKVHGGWLNAVGLRNIGIDRYIAEEYPRTRHVNVIVSIHGFTTDEWGVLIDRLEPLEIAGIELNLSCPNVEHIPGDDVPAIVRLARRRSRHPLIAKLSADMSYVSLGRLCEDEGINVLSVTNTVRGLRLNPRTGQPLLRYRFGGVSGAAIKPIGLRVVADLRDAGVRLPIIGGGGIMSVNDAREYIWAGADAAAFASIHFFSYWRVLLLLNGAGALDEIAALRDRRGGAPSPLVSVSAS